MSVLLSSRTTPRPADPFAESVLADPGIHTGTAATAFAHRTGPEGLGGGCSPPVWCSTVVLAFCATRLARVPRPPVLEHPLSPMKPGNMTIQILDALSRLAARRFGSFADAATAVLDLLESAAPGGCLVLGQVDWERASAACIDARGTACRAAVIRCAPECRHGL